jgi:hypothetical protein
MLYKIIFQQSYNKDTVFLNLSINLIKSQLFLKNVDIDAVDLVVDFLKTFD